MSTRHYLALSAARNQEKNIKVVSEYLSVAVSECEIEKINPLKDPAVLLISAHITFITNSDRHLYQKNSTYMDICSKEVSNDITAIQTPRMLN